MHIYDFSGEYFQKSVEFTTQTVIHALSAKFTAAKGKSSKVFTENMSLHQ